VAPDPDEPREPLRITDRRRFANLGEGFAGAGSGMPEARGPEEFAQEPTGSEEAEISGELETARAETAQYLDHLQRLQAEFDNYRNRVKRELAEAGERGAEPVVRRLLEVLDDFELALMHASEKPDLDRFLHGVELVYAKLLDSLKAEGLERMKAEGTPFDPVYHEALIQSGEGDGEPLVVDVLRPGYTLRGRVLRPAGVRVEPQG
jgi:molecular chaperone GrpE